jgi:hypothetical protein
MGFHSPGVRGSTPGVPASRLAGNTELLKPLDSVMSQIQPYDAGRCDSYPQFLVGDPERSCMGDLRPRIS